jgi:hypothetical protein
MGMDFTAILRCEISTEATSHALDALEATDRPMPLQAVSRCWQEYGYSSSPKEWRVPAWVKHENHEVELLARPPLPTLEADLRLPEGFFVTVAEDSIIVYHLLRWQLFLTEPKWQSVMFEALRWFCNEFTAKDCVLAHDCHWVVCGIREGMHFEEALSRAEREGGGRVDSFQDLYLELESDSDLALKPAKGNLAKCVIWPREKRLPRGWSRPIVWDSKGYWRFVW